MAQILVRDIDDDVVEHLKRQAKANGRSMQAEVRLILREAATTPKIDHETALRSLERLRERLAGRRFPDSVELIREGRDR